MDNTGPLRSAHPSHERQAHTFQAAPKKQNASSVGVVGHGCQTGNQNHPRNSSTNSNNMAGQILNSRSNIGHMGSDIKASSNKNGLGGGI